VIYQLEDGKTAETKIYDSESNEVLNITATRSGDVIKVTATGSAKNFKVRSAENLTVEMA
jgi:hypothetical protein